MTSPRYNRSWVTQRLLNEAPSWTRARRSPVSVAQQICNIPALEIEDVYKQLSHELDNSRLASCDPSLTSLLYKVSLPGRFEFNTEEDQSRYPLYYTPSVWAEIDGVEVAISQASENSIKSMFYTDPPTRIEYGERSELWIEVIPPTPVSSLSNLSPEELPIEGFLYVTLAGNSTWSEEYNDILYHSKIYLKGTGLLGETIEETVPLRLNGTYQTRSQWKTLDEFHALHVNSDAEISISVFPFREDPVAHEEEIAIDLDGVERTRFYSLNHYSWGSTLAAKRNLVSSDEQIRMGLDLQTIDYEFELLDDNSNNISVNAFVFKPWSNWAYVVDNIYLYVYDYRLPFPDVSNLSTTSGDSRLSIRFEGDRQYYTREDDISFFSRTLELTSIPLAVRWTLIYPNGDERRIGIDGSLWDTEIQEGWITNNDWDEGKWKEQSITLSAMNQPGTYVVQLEAKYKDDGGEIITRSAKEAFIIPAIEPETKLLLPVELQGARNIGIDGEGRLWFYNGTSILLSELRHDYFLVDFEKKELWFKEQYPSVRIKP